MVQATLFEQFDAVSPIVVLGTISTVEAPVGATPLTAGDNTATLSFEEFRQQAIFTPAGKIKDHALFRQKFPFLVLELPNEYANSDSSYEQAIESGRSYLLGQGAAAKDYLRRYASAMSPWQKVAFAWCMENPKIRLVLKAEKPRVEYHIYKRGNYVEIALPYQSAGGEKHWVSRDGLRKVLVNED